MHQFLKIILKFHLILGFVILFGANVGKPAQASTFEWLDQQFTYSVDGINWAIPQHDRTQSSDKNLVITRIRMNITNPPPNGIFDIALIYSRTEAPTYPNLTGGYSEILGFHLNRFADTSPWSIDIDLSDTPLFVPMQTLINCAARAYATTAEAIAPTRFSCILDTTDYSSGIPRYRSLRLPYLDQVVSSNLNIPDTPYRATSQFPLKARKAFLFQSFGGDQTPATALPCLYWKKFDGMTNQSVCFATQSIYPGANYDPPQPLSFSWDLVSTDYLTASCQNTRANTDCAIWVFVEIPPSIPPNPENSLANYQDTVTSQDLTSYCTQQLSYIESHPYLCNYQQPCDDQIKLATCTKIFPLATHHLGDLNYDKHIDVIDFNLLLADFSKIVQLINDITSDGKVNMLDAAVVLVNFGKTITEVSSYACKPDDPPAVFTEYSSLPNQVLPGEKIPVSLTVANCQTDIWPTSYHLTSVSPDGNQPWQPLTIPLPIELKRNQKVTVTFSLTAPAEEKTHALQWRVEDQNNNPVKPYSPPFIVSVGQASTCPQLESVKNTDTDAQPILQSCVDATGLNKTLEIPPGIYTFHNQLKIRRTITFRTAGINQNSKTCLTEGAPECAVFKAFPGFPSERISQNPPEGSWFGLLGSANNGGGLTLDHIILDGNRANRIDVVDLCNVNDERRTKLFALNAAIYGDRTKIFYSAFVNALCAANIAIFGQNNVFAFNLVKDSGINFRTEGEWSNGLDVVGANPTIMYNKIYDGSDIDFMVAAIQGGNVWFNTIAHFDQTNASWAAFLLNTENQEALANFEGADISYNTIDCDYRCGYGMQLGLHPWNSNAPNTKGGHIHHNTIRRARQGVNIEGAGTETSPLLYDNNLISESGGFDVEYCPWDTNSLNISPDSVVRLDAGTVADTNTVWHSNDNWNCTLYLIGYPTWIDNR